MNFAHELNFLSQSYNFGNFQPKLKNLMPFLFSPSPDFSLLTPNKLFYSSGFLYKNLNIFRK